MSIGAKPKQAHGPHPVGFCAVSRYESRPMARWPDNLRSTLTTAALIFILFPLLAWLAWMFVRG